MKIYVGGKKFYFCSVCHNKVYSLICRFINGEWYDICSDCLEKEVKGKCS